MTTASEIVNDALQAVGVIGQGETASAADAQFALRYLNRMLDSWSTERASVYEVFDESLTLSSGTASYLSTSLASTLRPVRVRSCRVTVSNVELDVQLIGVREWELLEDKTTATGVPHSMYAQMGMANATFKFYPIPNATYTAKLSVYRPLPATLVLGTTLSLPNGYELALVDNLSMQICRPMTGRGADRDLMEAARESKVAIQRANYQPIMLDVDLPFATRGANILLG